MRKLNMVLLCKAMRYSPVVLAGVSGYYLFLVVLPFFLLGVHVAPVDDVFFGRVNYIDQVGVLPWFGFAIVLLARYFTSVLWLLSAGELIRTRKWWILIVLALAHLPILYFHEGPYEYRMFHWTAPD